MKPRAETRRANPASSSCGAGCAAALPHRCSTPIRNPSTTTHARRPGTSVQCFANGIRSEPASTSPRRRAIAQDWLDLRAERSLSTFDQRHLLNLQAQYTTGQGLEGGTLLGGWRGRLLKEWTLLTQYQRRHRLARHAYFPAAVPAPAGSARCARALPARPSTARRTALHLNRGRLRGAAAGHVGQRGTKLDHRARAQFSLDGAHAAHLPSQQALLSRRCASTRQPAESRVFSSWNTTLAEHAIRPAAVAPTRCAACRPPCG